MFAHDRAGAALPKSTGSCDTTRHSGRGRLRGGDSLRPWACSDTRHVMCPALLRSCVESLGMSDKHRSFLATPSHRACRVVPSHSHAFVAPLNVHTGTYRRSSMGWS